MFVDATRLNADLLKGLRALGMVSAPPFMTGRPNIPALVDLALKNGLTVFRFDAALDKLVYIKSGVATEYLPRLLDEHAALASQETGDGYAADGQDQGTDLEALKTNTGNEEAEGDREDKPSRKPLSSLRGPVGHKIKGD